MTLEDLIAISKQHKVFIKITAGYDERAHTQYVRIHLRNGEERYNIYLPEGSNELADVESLIKNKISQTFFPEI